MAVNKTTIRIVVEGAPNAKQQLENLKKATDGVNKSQKGYNKGAGQMRGVTQGLQREIGRLRNIMLLYGFAIGMVVRKVDELVDVYKQQIQSEKLLENNLRNVAGTTADASKNLAAYASELQKATTFGDEQIISAMSMLATFQLTEDTIAQLTPRVLDMAAATGQDLTSAAIMAGKAVTGQVGALSRAGVTVDQMGIKTARAAGPVQEFAFIMQQLDNNFKGAAESLAATPVGRIDQLRNSIGDVEEQIGATTLPISFMFAKLKLGASEFASTFLKALEISTKKGIDFRAALGLAANEIGALGDSAKSLDEAGRTIETLDSKLKSINEKLKFRQSLNLEYTESLSEAGIADDERLDKLASQNNLENQLFDLKLAQAAFEEEKGAIEAANLPITMEMQQKGIDLAVKRRQVEMAIAQANAKSTATMLNSFAALNEAAGGNALVGARLAQAAAIIDMFAGANKAFAQGGVLGFTTSAAIIAAGTANVLNIEKQIGQMKKAATGADFVTDGPQVLMVGEAGRERVSVTPLEGPNIAGPQQSPVNINISGNVLSQDFVMEDVLPKIEEAVRVNLA